MRTALREVRGRLGQKYPLVIDGEKIWTGKLIASINPSSPKQVVGAVAEAGIPEAEARGRSRAQSFRPLVPRHRRASRRNCWNASPPSWTAAVSSFPRSKFSKSANRGPKPTATSARRSISCLFYAQQMRLRGRPRLTQHVPGEESYQHYWPRGVALVIAPWNFPIAILSRHGFRRARHRQHRHHEAGRAIGRLRRDADGDVRGSGRAARRAQFPPGQGLGHRRSISSITRTSI